MTFSEAISKLKRKKNAEELSEILADSDIVVETEKKKVHPVVIALAIIGTVAAIAGIAYCVYKYLIPEDSEDFEDFDDDYDFEDFDDEEDIEE